MIFSKTKNDNKLENILSITSSKDNKLENVSSIISSKDNNLENANPWGFASPIRRQIPGKFSRDLHPPIFYRQAAKDMNKSQKKITTKRLKI